MSEIIFAVEKAPEGGYVAWALGAAVFTEADLLEELREAVQDAVRCQLDEERFRVAHLHTHKADHELMRATLLLSCDE